MRGKPLKKAIEGGENRITPAGAGKTGSDMIHARHAADHPRRCGENDEMSTAVAAGKGSPPQVRGKLFPLGLCYRFVRITPAGAGKTYTLINSGFASKDHPRRCGENCASFSFNSLNLGSPPQVRGKLDVIRSKNCFYRITPAGAGKTYSVKNKEPGYKDHPRGCGENSLML